MNNFALSSGVGTAKEGARFEIYDSKIYNNYALLNPICLVFVTYNPSIFSNVEIFENEHISPDQLKEELTS